MNFWISLPCQIMTAMLVAFVVGSTCSQGFLPLNSVLGGEQTDPSALLQLPRSAIAVIEYGILTVIGFVATRFSLQWFLARKSHLMINRCQQLATVNLDPDFSIGLLRYRYSKVKVDCSRIDFSKVDTTDLPNLADIHRLVEFRAIETDLPIELLESLVRCPRIEKVNLSGCSIDDAQLELICQLKQLRKLWLVEVELNPIQISNVVAKLANTEIHFK